MFLKRIKNIVFYLFVIGLMTRHSNSIMIENSLEDGVDIQCDFNSTVGVSVWFVRSPYNCRIYHLCTSLLKQFTFTCAEGLFFDENISSCNFEHKVECNVLSGIQSTSSVQESSTSTSSTSSSSTPTSSTTPEAILSSTSASSSTNSKQSIEQTSDSTTTTTTTTPSITTINTSFEISTTKPVSSSANLIFQNKTLEQFKEGNSTESQSSTTFETTSTTTISSTVSQSNQPTSTPKTENSFEQVQNNEPGCIKGFAHKLAHKKSCALYYECKEDGIRVEKSCPYPLQYDDLFSECRPYDLVDCGQRAQAEDLCDYELTNPPLNSFPCNLYPSCKNLSDGLYPSSDCLGYFQCKDKRTLRLFNCPTNSSTGSSLRFNILTRRCDNIDNVPFNCGGYTVPIDVYTNKMMCPPSVKQNQFQISFELKDIYFSHPNKCNVYIECDKNGNMTEYECKNGTHFSPTYQSCVHPSVANCKKYPNIDETLLNARLIGHNKNSNEFKLIEEEMVKEMPFYGERIYNNIKYSKTKATMNSIFKRNEFLNRRNAKKLRRF